MRRDGVVYYLHTDHLGSTSLTTNASGGVVAQQRYYPYGGVRWSSGTLPTDYGFTGQRWEQSLGLYDYQARYYDPALGRFISADTLVPEPGNPQALNRYSYVCNNPLRYTDPTGYYSEEEIMRSFGVTSWDEVLAYFREGGALEGRWGWLEILRRAEDEYIVRGSESAPHETLPGEYISAWPGGFFSRNDKGEILVGGESNIEFALQHEEYILQRPGRPGYLSPYPKFYTRADWIHYHPHLRFGPDWEAAKRDLASIGLDAVGEAAIATCTPEGIVIGGIALGFGIAVDLGQAIEGFSRVAAYEHTGSFTSHDLFDIVGVVPAIGMYTDWASFGSNFTGLYIEITP